MTDLEDFEKAVRAEAERKIAAGRALHAAAASVLEVHENYRARYAEAVAVGFDESELKRLGLTVDGVKLAPTRPKTRAAYGGRGRPRSGPRSVASVAPATALAAAEDRAGEAPPSGADLTA
ncbi:hypothetical protein [Nocardia sp. NPDC004260]